MSINAATVSSLWQKLDTLTLTDDESAVLHRAFDAPMFVKRPVERVRARFGGGLWVGDSGGSRGRCSASRNG